MLFSKNLTSNLDGPLSKKILSEIFELIAEISLRGQRSLGSVSRSSW
jgi:hypothetical protein